MTKIIRMQLSPVDRPVLIPLRLFYDQCPHWSTARYIEQGIDWVKRQVKRRNREILKLGGRVQTRATRARIRKLRGQVRRREKQLIRLRLRLKNHFLVARQLAGLDKTFA